MSQTEPAATPPSMLRAYEWAASHLWAIEESALQTILGIASRELDIDLDAVEARLGRKLQNTHVVSMRDGVATIPVAGPIFRYGNLFTQISGATSVDILGLDLNAAAADSSVRAIVLQMDSPGGAVSGISEFAQMVRQVSARKPLVAYVSGQAQSAGYWIASAAPTVVVDDTSVLGSLGVVATIKDTRQIDERRGVVTHEIVSSQSPGKRPDPSTDAGRAQIQKMVDSTAAVFIGKVAGYRGVSEHKVLADFGAGGSLVGAQAVAAGMADRLGSYESVIADIAASAAGRIFSFPTPGPARFQPVQAKESIMKFETIAALEAANPELVAQIRTEAKAAGAVEATAAGKAIGVSEGLAAGKTEGEAIGLAQGRAEGAQGERDRIAGIQAHAAGITGLEALTAELIADGKTTPDQAAVKFLAAAKEKNATFSAALAADIVVPGSAPAKDGKVSTDSHAIADGITKEMAAADKDGRKLSYGEAADIVSKRLAAAA